MCFSERTVIPGCREASGVRRIPPLSGFRKYSGLRVQGFYLENSGLFAGKAVEDYRTPRRWRDGQGSVEFARGWVAVEFLSIPFGTRRTFGALSKQKVIYIATRGSALALAQASMVLAQCRAEFPDLGFELKITKTTGDKLQTASLAQEGRDLPKGLFTKELEVALIKGEADLAVHSLKDLPTELPAGLKLGAVGKREDVRDVLIYRSSQHIGGDEKRGRGFGAGLTIKALPQGAVVATSSTRRKAQVLALNPELEVIEIRGNVATRMQKLAEHPEMDATILALAGLTRLNFTIGSEGKLNGEGVPEGLLASVLPVEDMLPCVGQGAIGIEIRENDERIIPVCHHLNDLNTSLATLAERSFLSAMGGGCQSPVAAYAEVAGEQITMRALSFTHGPLQRAEGKRAVAEAAELGRELAARLG